MPTCFLEGGHDVWENEGIQGVVVKQEGVANIAAKYIDGKLAVESGAVKKMRDEIVTIRLDACVWLLCDSVTHAFVDIPVRSVDGDVADAISAFFEESAEAVALFGGVTLFEKRVAKQRRFILVGFNDFFIFQEIDGEIGVARRARNNLSGSRSDCRSCGLPDPMRRGACYLRIRRRAFRKRRERL